MRTIEQVCAGCCGDASWRGHHCEYHSGFDDGMGEAEAELDRLRKIEAAMLELFNESIRTGHAIHVDLLPDWLKP